MKPAERKLNKAIRYISIADAFILGILIVTVIILALIKPNTQKSISEETKEDLRQPENIGTVTCASDKGISFIAEFEGYTPYAVWDYAQYSYGYGSKASCEGEYISESDAMDLLREQIHTYESSVSKFADAYGLTLTQCQFDALVSFSYNIGSGWWIKYEDSDLVQLIASGEWTEDQIRDAFGQFCKAGGKVLKGLQLRRSAEADMFLGKI